MLPRRGESRTAEVLPGAALIVSSFCSLVNVPPLGFVRSWVRLCGAHAVKRVNAYRQGQSFRLFLPFGQRHRGFENPRLFKDRPADGAALAAQFYAGCVGGLVDLAWKVRRAVERRCMQCLPPGSVFQTVCPLGRGHRGFENPRLFKDRPADGAALAAQIYAGCVGGLVDLAGKVRRAVEWRCMQCLPPGSLFQAVFALWAKAPGV